MTTHTTAARPHLESPATTVRATTPTRAATSVASATSPIGLDLDLLGVTFARRGVAAVEGDLDLLATRARALGVDGPSVGVMVDDTAPEVVRARAFAHVARRLAAHRPTRATTPITADSFVAVA